MLHSPPSPEQVAGCRNQWLTCRLRLSLITFIYTFHRIGRWVLPWLWVRWAYYSNVCDITSNFRSCFCFIVMVVTKYIGIDTVKLVSSIFYCVFSIVSAFPNTPNVSLKWWIQIKTKTKPTIGYFKNVDIVESKIRMT